MLKQNKELLLTTTVKACVSVAVAGLLGGGGGRRPPGVLDVFPAARAFFNPDTTTESSERGKRWFT